MFNVTEFVFCYLARTISSKGLGELLPGYHGCLCFLDLFGVAKSIFYLVALFCLFF